MIWQILRIYVTKVTLISYTPSIWRNLEALYIYFPFFNFQNLLDFSKRNCTYLLIPQIFPLPAPKLLQNTHYSRYFSSIRSSRIQIQSLKDLFRNLTKTSLKIFKHYKLKPSFSIIKDEKVGVGDKPNLIKFDPI